MDAVAVLPLFEQLRQGLATWIGIRKDKSEKESEAVRALLAALTKTQIYLGSEGHADKPDRQREEELAEAWSEAAAAFYGIAPDIAPLLQLKSESWARPEGAANGRLRDHEAGIRRHRERDGSVRICHSLGGIPVPCGGHAVRPKQG